MVAQNSFGGCGSRKLKCRRRWRRKRGTLSMFTRLQSFLRLAGHKVTDLDLTFFAYRSKWPDKSLILGYFTVLMEFMGSLPVMIR